MKRPIFKKMLATILLALITLTTVACAEKTTKNNNATTNTTKKETTTTTNKTGGLRDYDSIQAEPFGISGWIAPSPTLENYQDYKDAGFNYAFLLGDYSGSIGSPKVEQILEICDELDIKCFVDCSKQLDAIKAVQETYASHPSFAGFNYDEPVIYRNTLTKCDGIVDMAPYVEKMYSEYPQIEFLVNLGPIVGVTYPWGTPTFTYDELIEAVMTNINSIYLESDTKKWLSCDDYPLYYDPSAKQKYHLGTTWLQNLEYYSIKKRDADYKITTNFFLQSMPYGTSEGRRDRQPTYEDLCLQLYTIMAFGYDMASYFCYCTPAVAGEMLEHQSALIDRQNNKTQTYYDSKKANSEINVFSNTYMQFNSGWLGVLPVYGTNNTKDNKKYRNNTIDCMTESLNLKYVSEIKSIDSNEDIIVGYMKDDEQNAGFMVVNYNDTTLKKTVDATIEFVDYNKALVYQNGTKTIVDLVDSKLNLNLGIGQGAFIIPFNE